MKRQLAAFLLVPLLALPFSSCAKLTPIAKTAVSGAAESAAPAGVSAASEPAAQSVVPGVSLSSGSSIPGVTAWRTYFPGPKEMTPLSPPEKPIAAGKPGSAKAAGKTVSLVSETPPVDRTANKNADTIYTVALPDSFEQAAANFSLKLLNRTAASGKNSALSPLGVYFALGMAENGAAGNTLKQFESVLGGGMELNSLNLYMKSYLLDLSCAADKHNSLNIADSLWFDNGLALKAPFLQKCLDYFGGNIYQTNLQNSAAVKQINQWVAEKTDNQITDAVDSLPRGEALALVSAVSFNSQWEGLSDSSGTFYPADGKSYSTTFMSGVGESYIEDDRSTGVVIPYVNSQFAFAAVLPNPGISPQDYLKTLDTRKFRQMVQNPQKNINTKVVLPKFTVRCNNDLSAPLAQMGLSDAFDSKADFSAASVAKISLKNAEQNVYMRIYEYGTQAAASMVLSGICGINDNTPVKTVTFNRPFLYAIIDTKTGVPLFIGTMEKPQF